MQQNFPLTFDSGKSSSSSVSSFLIQFSRSSSSSLNFASLSVSLTSFELSARESLSAVMRCVIKRLSSTLWYGFVMFGCWLCASDGLDMLQNSWKFSRIMARNSRSNFGESNSGARFCMTYEGRFFGIVFSYMCGL